jgi:hypothetical protein
MYIGLHINYLLFLSDFDKTWIFPTDFRTILTYQISWKSVQCEPSCYMRTDMTKLTVTFRNVAYAPERLADIPPTGTFERKVCRIFSVINSVLCSYRQTKALMLPDFLKQCGTRLKSLAKGVQPSTWHACHLLSFALFSVTQIRRAKTLSNCLLCKFTNVRSALLLCSLYRASSFSCI